DLSRGLRTLLATRTYLASLGTSSVVIHLVSVGSLWVLGNGLRLEVEGVVLFVAVPVAIFATTIPVSIAGWGVREGVMVATLGAFGVPPEGAFALSLLFGVALAVVSLPGAVLWLSGGTKVERAVADVQDAYRTL
ncbi:MAG: lysylphosphatidylglycerol synthase domain-containing protein, partial [bacterium]